jgi:taurine dioxygenase
MMALKFVPLGEAFGVEVRGFDPSEPVNDTDHKALHTAWREHLVLVVRGHALTDKQLIAFSEVFGELDPPGPNPYGAPFLEEHPELNVISNVVEDGKHIGGLGAGEAVWHADMTYQDLPPKAGVLHALELPDSGGDTYFANMIEAYESLPDDLKQRIEGRVAIHDGAHNSTGQLRKGYEEITDVRQTPGARHPLVRTDPDTGRKALFLGRRPHSYIVGLEVEESEALLDALWEHAAQPRFAYGHQWRVADTLIWNNLCLLHRRDDFDDSARRIMHRAQISGDHPVT